MVETWPAVYASFTATSGPHYQSLNPATRVSFTDVSLEAVLYLLVPLPQYIAQVAAL